MIEAVFASIIVTVVLVEIIFRAVRNPKLKLSLASVQSGFLQFRNATTDDERQQLMLAVGGKTLVLSSAFLGAFIALGAIAFCPPYLFAWNDSNEIIYLSSLTLLSILWFFYRAKSAPSPAAPAQSYGRLDRWLHHLALGSKTLRRVAFDLEKSLALTPATPHEGSDSSDRPVYVCGLARSGTTMLLRILDQVGAFRSLSYRDMPFVMAPNLWKQVSRFGERDAALAERAHGDGVLVGYDSPEAFEEVFWQTFDDPVGGAAAYGMPTPSRETLDSFAQYRRLVTNPKNDPHSGPPRRYLSKNNNNLVRLESLCAGAGATILLVYRDPIATARSLYIQHQRFIAAQQEDPFTLKYMSWLAHHEFGLAHKPFSFAVPAMNAALTPDQPDYWLDYWIAVYQYVLSQQDPQLHLVHHDTMCLEPEAFLARLFELLDVKADVAVLAREIRTPKHGSAPAEEFSPDLVRAAYQTYASLLKTADNILVSQP